MGRGNRRDTVRAEAGAGTAAAGESVSLLNQRKEVKSVMGMPIENLEHTKKYSAGIRKPSSFMENLVGYTIIKLAQDFEYNVEGNERIAKKGQYLAQMNFGVKGKDDFPAPFPLDTWRQVTNQFHVFRNKKGE